jgi:branched-chain amino acid transport system substrate-binding protein
MAMFKPTPFLFAAAVLILTNSVLARAEIRIAAVGPLTGQNIFTGEQIQQGAELAVANLNDNGGILGQRIELIVADDACDPDQAVAVAEMLVDEGVVFVAGHTCSHASIPASKIYEVAGILMISPASTNPMLTDEGGDNVFRVCGRDDQQGVVGGNYLADAWAGREIAILHDGTTYGKGLADETLKQLRKRGVAETLYEAYVPGEIDYSGLVAKMAEAGIDVVYIGGYATEAGLIKRQAHDRGYEIQVVGGDAITNDEFWMLAGPAGNGTRVTFGPDPRETPAAAGVVAQFRALAFEPSGYTLHSYAAIQVWAEAAERSGSLTLEALAGELRSGKFETVLGEIGFDQKGDITTPSYIWYVWNEGEYVPVH